MGESLGVECTGGLMQRGERLALLMPGRLADRVGLGRPRPAAGPAATGVAYFIGVAEPRDRGPPHRLDRAAPARGAVGLSATRPTRGPRGGYEPDGSAFLIAASSVASSGAFTSWRTTVPFASTTKIVGKTLTAP